MALLKAQQGDIPSALTQFQQCLEISESIHDLQGKAATLYEIARLTARKGDIPSALTQFQKCWEIFESIHDLQGKAATLHEMALLKTEQGDITSGIRFLQQSVKIYEKINNAKGKAAMLNSRAYFEGKRGDKAKQLELTLQAAQIFGQVHAYVDLFTTLVNLAITDEIKGIIYIAQAVWLSLRIHTPLANTVMTIDSMYKLLGEDDEMEALLGAVAIYLCQVRGDEHPQLEKLQERSFQILAGAATAQGIETQEAFDNWYVQQRLNDPDYFIPRLVALLEAIVGDEWLFDRF
jgi:tetratricopeptide (TPR) repeat protein